MTGKFSLSDGRRRPARGSRACVQGTLVRSDGHEVRKEKVRVSVALGPKSRTMGRGHCSREESQPQNKLSQARAFSLSPCPTLWLLTAPKPSRALNKVCETREHLGHLPELGAPILCHPFVLRACTPPPPPRMLP